MIDLDHGWEDTGDPVGPQGDAVRLPDAPQRLALGGALVRGLFVVQGEEQVQLLENKKFDSKCEMQCSGETVSARSQL